jgi:hypothetical protein
MKKSVVFNFGIIAAAAALCLVSCASAPGTSAPASAQASAQASSPAQAPAAAASGSAQGAAAKAPAVNNIDTAALHSTIIDWLGRDAGLEANPAWLKPTLQNNFTLARQALNLGANDIVYVSVGRDASVDNAQIEALAQGAQQIAFRFRSHIEAGFGRDVSQGVKDLTMQIAQTTTVDLTGNTQAAQTWRLIQTDEDGVKTKAYTYYIAWSIPQDIYTQLFRKYVNEIIGKIPDTAAQKLVAQSYANMTKDINHQQALSDAQFKQQLALQQQAANARDAATRAAIVAQMNRDNNAAATAQTQIEANSAAQRAAAKSGNAKIAAVTNANTTMANNVAAVTPADKDWISILAGDPGLQQ